MLINIDAFMPIKCGVCGAWLPAEIVTCKCGVNYVSYADFLGSQPDIRSVLTEGATPSISFHPPK